MGIDEILDEIRAVNERARTLAERTGTELLCRRPAEGEWSIAECLEHLNMTTRAFLPRWRTVLAQAPRGDTPYRTDLWGKLLLWTLEPPPKFRMPTTAPFLEFRTPAEEQVVDAFLQCQKQLVEAVEAGRGLALDRVKVASPFNERMRYSVWSSFRVTMAHERRHLWQAERVSRLTARLQNEAT